MCFLPVGNRGIGLEVARHLAGQRCFVFLSGCDLLATKEADADLLAENLQVEVIQLDLNDHDQIYRAVKIIDARFNLLDILINNTAVFQDEGESVFELTLDVFQTTLDVNLIVLLRLTQRFLQLLKNSAAGRVVNVFSGMGALHMA